MMKRIIRVGEEFDLDWKRDELRVWQPVVSDMTILAMIEGIKLGCRFPAVDVVMRRGIYELVHGQGFTQKLSSYGGHHRAVAHYIHGALLRCNLLDEHREDVSPEKLISIGEVVLRDGCSMGTLPNALDALPMWVVKKFCEENNIDEIYLSQRIRSS